MKTEDYNVGDIVYNPENETLGFGVVTRKRIILWVRWDNIIYDKLTDDSAENGLSIRIATSKIRDEKLKQLGIW